MAVSYDIEYKDTQVSQMYHDIKAILGRLDKIESRLLHIENKIH